MYKFITNTYSTDFTTSNASAAFMLIELPLNFIRFSIDFKERKLG